MAHFENTIGAVSTVSTKSPHWRHAFDIPSPKFCVTTLKWLEKTTYDETPDDENNNNNNNNDDENNNSDEDSFFFRQTHNDSSGLVLAGTGLQVFEWWPKDPEKEKDISTSKTHQQQQNNNNESNENTPLMRFTCDLPRPIKTLSCSPDGRFIATTGRTDTLVKVWFRRPQMPQCCLLDGRANPKCTQPAPDSRHWVTFFVLRHPGTVVSLSWLPARRGRCGQNVLMTNAVDSTVRLWAERLIPEDSISSPVPSRDYPRLFLCGEVPAAPCSLVEWVMPFYTYKVQEKEPDDGNGCGSESDDDDSYSDGSDGGYSDESDSEKERRKAEKRKKRKEEKEAEANDGKKKALGPFSHSLAECPLLENNTPKTQRKLKGTTVEWIMELNREGVVSLWKFSNDPFQTPKITLWSQVVNNKNIK